MRKKFLIFASLSFFLLFGLARAADINVNLPGVSSADTNPGAWVKGFYEFSLMIAGLLGFGMIVYAGLRYAFAAGNPSTQSDARDQILQALLGLLLLFGAYIVLTTINPNLVNLELPGLMKIQNPPNTTNTNSANNVCFKCNLEGSSGCFPTLEACNASCVGGVGAACTKANP